MYDDTPPVYENSIVYDGRTVFVICEESGTYTVAFANYDKSGKLSGLKAVAQEFAQGYNTVSMPNGMQLSAGSRLFLLESIETMKPMCRTFTVDDIKK